MDPERPSHEYQSTPQSPNRDETSTQSDDLNNRSSDTISSPVSTFRSMSPTQSPPIQIMERPEDYEFEYGGNSLCSSSSTSEWSSVTDESLFSIHITNSYTHDEASLLATDVFQSGKSMESDLTTFSSPMNEESDLDSVKAETPSKSDVPKPTLDEPQKVVRWKTQVERLAHEGAPSQGHKWQPSPSPNHKSNEPGNHTTTKPKKKVWWSWCKCGSCKMPKMSCGNSCWKGLTCSSCKPKKVSSHSTEANAAPKKPDVKHSKPPASKRECCCKPSLTCFSSFSCSYCHCFDSMTFA